MMNYDETLAFLYAQLPTFEVQGPHAYKPGLERCEAMDAHLGHPHRRYRTLHVAGTNGKGSTAHTLAAVLQASDRRTGLFTSPHLLDFAERIRVDGQPIDHGYVVRWVERWHPVLAPLAPTFFELTTMMAFSYFADRGVDVAVVEVGLGGRLDATNIIRPDLCIITNISADHTQLLGSTLPQIAAEKAGIMKAGVPCVVGECDDPEVRSTFCQAARQRRAASLTFACDERPILWVDQPEPGLMRYRTCADGDLLSPLTGDCQPRNAATVLCAVAALRQLGYGIPPEALSRGMRQVVALTGLRGRWETLATWPDGQARVVADTGHNEGCFRYLGPRLEAMARRADETAGGANAGGGALTIVFGMMADKAVETVLRLLPPSAPDADGRSGLRYLWCAAPSPRALPAAELQSMAASLGLEGDCYPSPADALCAALASQAPGDVTFVGGSGYVVCEAMRYLRDHPLP